MDTVIKRISEIEKAAVTVMDDAAEMEEKTRQFDQTAEEETEKKVKSLRQEMETRMHSELSEQKAEAEEQLARMEKNYELHHESYVKKLFQELIRE